MLLLTTDCSHPCIFFSYSKLQLPPLITLLFRRVIHSKHRSVKDYVTLILSIFHIYVKQYPCRCVEYIFLNHFLDIQ